MDEAAGRELTFEQVALQHGIITRRQLDECLAVQKKVTDAGLEVTLDEVLLKKGYLSKQKLAAINAVIGRGRTSIEGYTVFEKIGQGGWGAVYRAKQNSLDRIVALKVLLPRFAKERDAVERFLREAKALARLNHPNIVGGIDAGYSNGIYYYAMEYLDGETLESVMKRIGSLRPGEALAVAAAVAKALDHANRNAVIHRDIKPGNIFLLRSGGVKLADLGLARIVSGDDIYITQTGVITGTPAYISPEMARGDRTIDIRSDVYSLGMTLFEMLTGRAPFESPNALVVVTKHATTDVPMQPLEERSVSPSIVAIVRKMTMRDKRARYQTPAELLEDLEAAQRGDPVAAEQVATAPAGAAGAAPSRPTPVHYFPQPGARRGNQAIAVVLGGVILVGAVALASLVLRSGGGTPSVPWGPQHPSTAAQPAPESSSREQKAAQAYAAAERFERDRASMPNSAAEILAHYEEALDACRLTSLQGKFEEKVERYRSLLAAEIGGRADALAQRVSGLVAQDQHGTALREIAGAEDAYRGDAWKERLRQLKIETEGRLKSFVETRTAQADLAVEREDYAAAVAALAPLAKIGDPATERRAQERIAQIEKLKRNEEALSPAEKHEQQRFRDAIGQLLALAKNRDFAGAANLARETGGALSAADQKAEMQRYEAWMQAALALIRQASDAMGRVRVGEHLSLEIRVDAHSEKIDERVSAAAAGSLTLERGRSVTPQQLAAPSLVELASRPIDGRVPPVDARGPALIAVLDGDDAAAVAAMERVRRTAHPVPARLAEAFDEAAARRLLFDADLLHADGRRREAADLYRRLRELYARTRTYADGRDRVDARANP